MIYIIILLLIILWLPLLFFGSFFIGGLIFGIYSKIIKKEYYGKEKKDE